MFKYLTTLILASSIAFAADASAADVKIGAISVPYIIQSIPQTKAAEAKIKKATASKEKAIDKIQSEGKALTDKMNNPKTSPGEKANCQRKLQLLQTELQIKVSELREEQQKIGMKENEEIMHLIEKGLETVAKEKNLDIVFKAESIAWVKTQAVDISDDVIKVVSKSK